MSHSSLVTDEFARTPPPLYSVDLSGCTDFAHRSPEEVMAVFGAALRRAGATVVEEVFHLFPETGLTCVLILTESHAVIHTWPESGTVNIDIFSCSTRLRSLEAIAQLRTFLPCGGCFDSGNRPCRRILLPSPFRSPASKFPPLAAIGLQPCRVRPLEAELGGDARLAALHAMAGGEWLRAAIGAPALPIEVGLACSGRGRLCAVRRCDPRVSGDVRRACAWEGSAIPASRG